MNKPIAPLYWKRVNLLVFIAILVVASFLRIYKLDEIPPGLNRDEASIGYTAYSLLVSQKDEYGKTLPLSFQSFGDWKLPLYIYATVPFVKALGKSDMAVRLPSAIAGIVTVGLVYFLSIQLFHSSSLSLFIMGILATSPWHIHLSRVESESNVAVMLITSALIVFIRAIQQKKYQLFILSSVLFALTYYTYHGNHISTTLLLIGLLYTFRKSLPKNKFLIIAVFTFFVITGIILFQSFLQADVTKISGISIFGNPNIVHEKIELVRNTDPNPQGIITRIFHNRIVYAIEAVTQNYLRSFSTEFLFIRGGTNHAHNIATFGNLYMTDAPFLLIGFYILLRKRKERKYQFLLWWLVISPIASSLTKDAPHTNRLFFMYPLLPILIGLGIFWSLHRLKNYSYARIIACIISGIYLLNIVVYMDRYYIDFPRNEAHYWGIGYKMLNDLLSSPELRNKTIIVSQPEQSPYIFFLWYSTFNPIAFQHTVQRYPQTRDGFTHVAAFGRYKFKDIQWDIDLKLPNTILVDYSEHIPKIVKNSPRKQYEIILPNGRSLFTAVEASQSGNPAPFRTVLTDS